MPMRFEKILKISFVCALISCNTTITVLLAIFIVGMPLMFANTVFVYLLSVYPAVMIKRSGMPNWITALGGALGLFAMGVGIPAGARLMHALAENKVKLGDFQKSFSIGKGDATIVLNERDNHPARAPGLEAAQREAPCEQLCLTFLKNSDIDTVYVKNKSTVVAYTEADKKCELVTDHIGHPFNYCYGSAIVENIPMTQLVVTATVLGGLFVETENWAFAPWKFNRAVQVKITTDYNGHFEAALHTYIEGEVASIPLEFDYTDTHAGTLVPDSARMHREAISLWQSRTIDVLSGLMTSSRKS